jgi:formylglycine-generating enzyme required for sulfatase activity
MEYASSGTSADATTTRIPAGDFESVLPIEPGRNRVHVEAFRLDTLPVTNAAFAAFVRAQPKWRRDQIAPLYADGSYLAHWQQAGDPGAAIARQPVTRVSWFAASAYCQARGARMPTWYEWEYVAGASETARDARNDPKWRQTILHWYAQPATQLADVGRGHANFYRVHDMQGFIWEWVDDFNGMLVSGDSREQGDPDIARFCGSGAVTMEQKEQYAVLMRVAMLSSLKASYTTANLGFRCALDGEGT